MKQYLYALWMLMLLTACGEKACRLTLEGEWRFALDPDDRGIQEEWYNRTLEGGIRLPGSLQEQGYGKEIGTETKWTGQIVDSSWYTAPEYAPYRQPGNIKVPFWLNPDKHYVGVAWYQRDIQIPASWSGRPVELELERTHWETTLFLDGKEMGKHESLSTPFRHRFAGLQPGTHRITLRVDNRLHIPVGENAHSVSDHTQTNWNGIIGSIRLIVRPQLYIDDLQRRGSCRRP